MLNLPPSYPITPAPNIIGVAEKDVLAFFDEHVPHLGGNLAPVGTTARDIAEWIDLRHRAAVALVLGMSYPTWPDEQDGYVRLKDPRLSTVRIGVWVHLQTGQCVLGCRATGIGATGALSDLRDDKVISGMGKAHPMCDLTIVREGKQVLQRLLASRGIIQEQVLIAGYSLGGSAALCLGTQFPNVKVVSLAGGAPPSNPVLMGPGPGRATHYHVVGDLVSSHVSPQAAAIVRVDKGYTDFSFLHAHVSGRFLRRDAPAGRRTTADAEDDLFVAWALKKSIPATKTQHAAVTNLYTAIARKAAHTLFPAMANAVDIGSSLIDTAAHLYYARVACRSPIPGSMRFVHPGDNRGLGATLCSEAGLANTAPPASVPAVEIVADADNDDVQDTTPLGFLALAPALPPQFRIGTIV